MLPTRTAAAVIARRAASVSSVNYSRWASTLVVSEPLVDGGATPAATQSAVTAAKKLGNTSIDLLVVGGPAPTKIPDGVSKVYHVAGGKIDPNDQKHVVGETVAAAIEAVATSKDCNVVVGTSSKFGSSIVPRAAALLDVSPVTDILEIDDESESVSNTTVRSFCRINSLVCYSFPHETILLLFLLFLGIRRHLRSSHVFWKCPCEGSIEGNWHKGLVNPAN